MKVMLIQPPMFHLKVQLSPNLGLAYIAAVLERDGFDVQVLDAAAENLDFDGVIERIRAFSPAVIGAGGQTPVSVRSMTIFRRAKKEIDQDIVTVAGGPHFSFTDRQSLAECAQLDVVVRGEGEETMSQLCKRIAAGETLDDVSGITWRNRQGEVVRNPDRPPIADIDSIPFPAWHLFPVDKYHWVGNRLLATSSSRGCPYRCPYCITWKMHQGIRHRDPAKIVEEMVWVKSTFGHDTFFFQDDVSFLAREQLEGFLDELEKCGEKLYWYYEAREDILLDFRDLWERMQRNGLFKIVIGLESPDPVQRERMGKSGYDLGAVDSMLQTLEKDLDIMVSVYLLFGILEDTEESMDALLQYARHLYPDYCSFVVGSIAVPYPGTSKFIELKEKDLLSTYDWSDYGFSTSVIKASFSSQKLQDIFSGFWVGTYVRPKALLKQVELLLSRNRFRRAMAKQYITMAVEMISDVEKMKGERKDGF
ncbi:MAG: radical SAM protein [Anaerolineae bacterium]|jgi:radical SAM superfamily enzyme YgiQ (UPF0313 family)